MIATPGLKILLKGTYCLVGKDGIVLDASILNTVF